MHVESYDGINGRSSNTVTMTQTHWPSSYIHRRNQIYCVRHDAYPLPNHPRQPLQEEEQAAKYFSLPTFCLASIWQLHLGVSITIGQNCNATRSRLSGARASGKAHGGCG